MKIGIFGGSCDPVHIGHIELAKQAIESGIVDKVIFIPAANQPFKLDRKMADGYERLKMIEIAIDGIPNLEVSDYELARPDDVSYTINTLNGMREEYADDEIFFITGADSFIKIHTWTRPEEILRNFPIIVGLRPGYKEEDIAEQERELGEKYGARVYKLENDLVDISSTELRELIIQGKLDENDPRASFVPKKVKEYIVEQRVYN